MRLSHLRRWTARSCASTARSSVCTGHDRAALLGTRFRDLLAPAGRIYHETHFLPLLQMQGAVREIALDIVRADGSRLPALVNAVQQCDEAGTPRLVRTTVFDATDRRAYEQELLRARRREQDIAQQLQRSLLSGTLAASPALAVDVFYRPAQAGLEVGGDWYDAFWLDDERTVAALVVGDVVGRGIEAAAAMGQLRSAIRALASTGLAPGPLLDALDGFVARHRVGRMTTVAYAQLDVATGGLRYACAGHPPPILLAPGVAPRLLWDGRSVPLDSVAIGGPRRRRRRPAGARRRRCCSTPTASSSAARSGSTSASRSCSPRPRATTATTFRRCCAASCGRWTTMAATTCACSGARRPAALKAR